MIAATNNMHEAGIRKAAILVASLDRAAADLLLDNWAPSAPIWCARRRWPSMRSMPRSGSG